MNSDTRRILSQFDTRGSPDFHQYYADGQLRNRFTNPSLLITIALLAATIVYQAAHQQRELPSIPQLLWDASVTVIPGRLLFAIDRLMNPPLFPTHLLKAQPPTRAAKSDALRRILGMDNGGGIIGSVSQAGRKGLSSLSNATLGGSRAGGDQPPGLGNYDNSCYQNSILQGLASLKPFPAYLSAVSLERRLDLAPTRTVDTLRELIADLSSPSNNGRTFWTPKVLKNMSTWQQQDAQEYYSKLLDQIDTEIAKAARALRDSPALESDRAGYDSSASQDSDDSGYQSLPGHSKPGSEPRLARNPLEGLMAQRVACVNCGYCEGLNMIPFNCLTLTLGNLSEHDIYERLDHYTKVEPIEGVECPKCTLIMCRDLVNALAQRTGMVPEFQQRLQVLEEALEEEAFDEETLTKKCNITAKMKVSATKTKQVALARPPQSLVFHVNRSGFDEQTGYMFKNSAAVRFPMMLDLGPWCLGSSGGQANLEEGVVAARDVEQWTLDPKASMVAGDRGPSRITGPMYELRAVVTHWGQHDTGHYVCYRKHPISSPPAAMTSEGTDKHVESASGENGASDSMDLDGETGPIPEVDDTKSNQDEPPNQDQAPSQWWRLSDDDVWQVDEQTVLSQGGVFMLFYDCVDPNSVLVSDLDTSAATEQAAEGPNVSNGVLTPLRVAPDPDTVQQNDGASTESVDLMQLDDALPLPGTSTQPDAVPDSPKMGEMGDEQEDASRNPHTLIESHTHTAWDSKPAQDGGQSQASTDSMGQPVDGRLALPSLSRVSDV
jgi:ubiquitin carboxyl-terminal hydrolase 1